MKKVIYFLKDNIKIILFYIFLIVLMLWEFPYYIDAPGGIVNVNERININNSYESTGSFNLAYVSEYSATIPTLVYSLLNKDWKVMKKEDVLLENESYSDYEKRDRLLMEEAYSNAIYVGYTKANCEVNIQDEKIYVNYVFEESNTTLEIADQIIEINGHKVKNKQDIDNIVNDYSINDKITIKVIKNGKEKIREATLIEYNNKPIIGISVIKVRNIDTNPDIKINYKSRESGPSGGLILALAIYNNLVSEDITKGLTIVGTGTIDEYGNVGSIGGADYKLKSAVKMNADIFIVPNGANYEEVIKLKEKNNYNIEIVGVSTFDDVINYLKNRE